MKLALVSAKGTVLAQTPENLLAMVYARMEKSLGAVNTRKGALEAFDKACVQVLEEFKRTESPKI